jgi:hypothetical protein
MTGTTSTTLRTLAVLALAVLALAAPFPAWAETDQPIETTPVFVQDAGASAGDRAIAAGVLVFGGAALLMTLLYLNSWRRATTSLARATLEKTGRLPVYEHNPIELQAAGARGIGEPASTLKIRGPSTLYVGRPATFTAVRDDKPVEAAWSVEPATATVEPERATAAKVTASRAGPVTVRAEVEGTTAEAHAGAVRAPARSGSGSVPLVGLGYGGVTIAIVAVTVAGAITALGVLDGAALAALLGTVVGYFFVERRSQPPETPQAPAESEAEEGGGP